MVKDTKIFSNLTQELKEIESKVFVDSEPEFGVPEVRAQIEFGIIFSSLNKKTKNP